MIAFLLDFSYDAPMFKQLSTLDSIFIVLMAVFGIALKPIVGPLAQMLASVFVIQPGAVAGAVYMIWPMLALLVVKRFGGATSVGVIQGIIVMLTGLYGSHGVLSLATYILPCLMIDLAYLSLRRMHRGLRSFLPTALGNAAGSGLVGWLLMRLPWIPLSISVSLAFCFGGFAGLFAYGLYRQLIRTFPQYAKEAV